MVVLVRDDDAVHAIARHGGRTFELAVSFSGFAKVVQELAGHVVHLDAVVGPEKDN